VQEEFQEAIFKIVDRIRPESSFYLLLSNSLIPPGALPSPPPEEIWRFRRLTMGNATDEYGERLFKTGLHQQVMRTDEWKMTIHLNDLTAVITLEQHPVYWDRNHLLTIRTLSEEEKELQHQLDRVRNSVHTVGLDTI
jgi:hypothetical protein